MVDSARYREDQAPLKDGNEVRRARFELARFRVGLMNTPAMCMSFE